MLDVAIRVQAIRPFAVSQMAILLENAHLLANKSQRNGICEVLYAAAWISGEFSEHLPDPRSSLEAMLRPKVTTLPGHIQSVFVQNIIKLYSSLLVKAELENDDETIKEAGQLLIDKLPMFVQSADLEVQERACCILQLIKYVQKYQDKGTSMAEEVSSLFAGELNPVGQRAQRKVPVPEGLDLDKWINEPLSDSSDEEISSSTFFTMNTHTEYQSGYQDDKKHKVYEPTEEELQQRREVRKAEQLNNPHYLKGDSKSKKRRPLDVLNNINDIPVTKLDLDIPLQVTGLQSSDKYLKEMRLREAERRNNKVLKKKKKRKRGKKEQEASESDDDVPTLQTVSATFDLPEVNIYLILQPISGFVSH